MTTSRSAFVETALRLDARSTPREAAIAYATAGVPVFPIAADGKRPLTKHGFRDATTDRRQVEEWWSPMPSSNVGIPTGATSGVVVVDVDVHETVTGYPAFSRARRAGLVDGWEILVRSPSGGMHAYFPADGAQSHRSWQAARAGIDFRGDGGYIIVPPSRRVISGHPAAYMVEKANHAPSALLDSEGLREFLDPSPGIRVRTSAGAADRARDVGRLAGWVARRPEGERNHGLFWAACKLAEHDVSSSDALEVLATAGTQAGLSEREIMTTVRSAYRTVHGASITTSSDRPVASRPDSAPPAAVRPRVLG
jgi:hypothetical protein